ncbi:hypothetical protein GCM10008098_29540 [Rhodanobacter panaciterrae]|uniref:Uncharacterized protein n=1 Tax=Rhodanobacter panaciterrae TaxID=490572 RepID=A0ABQ3A7C3_9GAMM|nr:hypothetical protein GCM10008098_29540 [Rhodanobacter panaciterrae]
MPVTLVWKVMTPPVSVSEASRAARPIAVNVTLGVGLIVVQLKRADPLCGLPTGVPAGVFAGTVTVPKELMVTLLGP